jgi:hypothetical protein
MQRKNLPAARPQALISTFDVRCWMFEVRPCERTVINDGLNVERPTSNFQLRTLRHSAPINRDLRCDISPALPPLAGFAARSGRSALTPIRSAENSPRRAEGGRTLERRWVAPRKPTPAAAEPADPSILDIGPPPCDLSRCSSQSVHTL